MGRRPPYHRPPGPSAGNDDRRTVLAAARLTTGPGPGPGPQFYLRIYFAIVCFCMFVVPS